LLFDLLGHVPEPGESVDIAGLRLVADRVKGRRIERVRIIPLSSLAAGY
jgi:CBS domain containing-hemolysin-like protein